MFLKSVELFGFKSFADRTRFEFSPGVSALLGPNGCGKSNVVDAIKWVLGEQAPRSLRADRMEAIIFNGTESRKPVSVAEVTLTLENEDGSLPLDHPEIEIRRRLYRSGESEYSINGRPVRLRDVRDLFMDTGIGKSSYSIMEQGRIDQILSTRPEDRRAVFEEAAGITRFRAQGAEAERKLDRTEENISQVEQILAEVKRTHDRLQKQAEQTSAYRELREQQFELEKQLSLVRVRDLTERLSREERERTEADQERQKLRTRIDSLNETQESSIDEVNGLESTLVERQKSLFRSELARENKRSQRRLLVERAQEIQSRIDAGLTLREQLETQRTRLEEEQKAQTDRLQTLEREVADTDANIASFARDIESLDQRITDSRETETALEQRIDGLEHTREELLNRLRTVTDQVAAEVDAALGETETSGERWDALRKELAAQLSELSAIAQRIGDLARAPEPSAGLAELASRMETVVRAQTNSSAELDRLIPESFFQLIGPNGALAQKRRIDRELDQIRDAVGGARAQIAAERQRREGLAQQRAACRRTLGELQVNEASSRESLRGVQAEQQRINVQLASLADQVKRTEDGIGLDRDRLAENRESIARLERESNSLQSDESGIRKELEKIEAEIAGRHEHMQKREQEIRSEMDRLARLQKKLEGAQVKVASTQTEIRSQYDAFRERHSRDLRDYEGEASGIAENLAELRDRLSAVKEHIRAMGSVNLMAPEEFAQIADRYEFLRSQLSDLREARADLQEVMGRIHTESADRFVEAYGQIKRSFHDTFRRLFGGGRAELRLTDESRVLDSGIEILVQPPGKKLENIALLSGGERALTAVGLLFATYMVRPSPFTLLDEIDAALDDANVGRFVSMLLEFAEQSQFVVITHNKRTASGAHSLLGVTMEDSGVSKLVTLRLADHETVGRG